MRKRFEFEKRRILLVEDDVRNEFAITRVLEPHGAILKLARNGREALEVLEKNSEVDRVLIDILNHRAAGGRGSLSGYYHASHENAVMAPALRQQITFADHSLATDSTFSEVQLVSCRNVLIYFDRELRDRALGLFNDALCRRGFLCLGSKESVRFSAQAPRFTELNAEQKIYRRVD